MSWNAANLVGKPIIRVTANKLVDIPTLPRRFRWIFDEQEKSSRALLHDRITETFLKRFNITLNRKLMRIGMSLKPLEETEFVAVNRAPRLNGSRRTLIKLMQYNTSSPIDGDFSQAELEQRLAPFLHEDLSTLSHQDMTRHVIESLLPLLPLKVCGFLCRNMILKRRQKWTENTVEKSMFLCNRNRVPSLAVKALYRLLFSWLQKPNVFDDRVIVYVATRAADSCDLSLLHSLMSWTAERKVLKYKPLALQSSESLPNQFEILDNISPSLRYFIGVLLYKTLVHLERYLEADGVMEVLQHCLLVHYRIVKPPRLLGYPDSLLSSRVAFTVMDGKLTHTIMYGVKPFSDVILPWTLIHDSLTSTAVFVPKKPKEAERKVGAFYLLRRTMRNQVAELIAAPLINDHTDPLKPLRQSLLLRQRLSKLIQRDFVLPMALLCHVSKELGLCEASESIWLLTHSMKRALKQRLHGVSWLENAETMSACLLAVQISGLEGMFHVLPQKESVLLNSSPTNVPLSIATENWLSWANLVLNSRAGPSAQQLLASLALKLTLEVTHSELDQMVLYKTMKPTGLIHQWDVLPTLERSPWLVADTVLSLALKNTVPLSKLIVCLSTLEPLASSNENNLYKALSEWMKPFDSQYSSLLELIAVKCCSTKLIPADILVASESRRVNLILVYILKHITLSRKNLSHLLLTLKTIPFSYRSSLRHTVWLIWAKARKVTKYSHDRMDYWMRVWLQGVPLQCDQEHKDLLVLERDESDVEQSIVEQDSGETEVEVENDWESVGETLEENEDDLYYAEMEEDAMEEKDLLFAKSL